MRIVQAVDHEFAVLKEQAIIPGQFKDPIVKPSGSQNRTLPLELTFLSVEPNSIVVSSIKRAEDGKGIIIRLYNTTNKAVTGTIRWNMKIKKVLRVNMREEPADEIGKQKNRGHVDTQFLFEAPPFRVQTYELIASSASQIEKSENE
jgi:alpha-mannosidase